MNNVFAFQAHWYDDWNDTDGVSQGAVFAEDMTDAMDKIARRLPGTSCVMITELSDEDFIFMDEAHYAEFEHDISAFDKTDTEQDLSVFNERSPDDYYFIEGT